MEVADGGRRCQTREARRRHWYIRAMSRARSWLVVLASVLVGIVGATSSARASSTPYRPPVDRPALGARAIRDCARSMPVCVHASSRVADAVVARTVERVARAYEALFLVQKHLAPLSDGALGGDARLDVYLRDDDREAGVRAHRDALALDLDRDAASGFLTIGATAAADDSCAVESEIARGLVELEALGLDVAETPAIVGGLAAYASSLAVACPTAIDAARAAHQADDAHPIDRDVGSAETLAWFLDTRRGGGNGALVPAVLSMATEHAFVLDGAEGPVFSNDPSVVEVLRRTLFDQGSSLDDELLAMHATRVTDLPAPPHPDWQIVASSLPRRLMIRAGVPVTGASFVRIDLDAPMSAADAIELDLKWDALGKMRFRVVKVGPLDAFLGAVAVADLDTQREVTVEVRGLERVKAVVLVAVNVGDREHPWQPDGPEALGNAYEVSIFHTQ